MNRVSKLCLVRVILGLCFVFPLVLALTYAETADKTIVSRMAEVDGVKLHYLTAGHGPAVILLHGYAETSRMWRPIIPVLAEKFTVIAPDLPGIGDSAIPANGLDMKTSATRIHALARSLGVEKARVVGHDIGLMVAYAYATQFPAETEKRVVMDAFLPGVAGWEPIYNAPNVWHFRFNGEYPEKLVKGRERTYFEYFWNVFAADKTHSIPEADRKAYTEAYSEARADASSVGLFRVVAGTGEGFRATLANEADDAGVVDRRREVARKRTRPANETSRDRRHSRRAEGHRPLDSGGTAKGNNRRAG